MKRNAVVSALVVVAVIAAVVAVVLLRPTPKEPSGDAAGAAPSPTAVAPEVLVREDSHRISTAPAGSPVFVEFLDFECEACRAAFPLVEQLRKEYAGKVEFVIRYFPIDSHANAMNAALAVEAAARQGKLEQMYQTMYETQSEWGEQKESKAALFRSFAEALKLDMAAYDRDVASDEVRQRVVKDREDGLTAGVQGTPTFFLDGARIQPRNEQELRDLVDKAIAS